MSKSILNLTKDIYALFGSGHKPSQANVDDLAKAIALHVTNALAKKEPKGTLRGSIMGTKCDRKLWYMVNTPKEAEDFNPNTLFTFLYGNILEETVLFLAQEAGHSVEKRQHKVNVEGVEGHIDAVIDGMLVDVKSANSRSMDKFKNHQLEHDDPFGYLEQISFYKEGMKDDPSISIKGQVGFLAVDKERGGLVLDVYKLADDGKARENTKNKIVLVGSSDLPDRGYSAEPDGLSGNEKLCMECKYCAHKYQCWPGVRKFLYSNGPRWLTKVIKLPNNIPEEVYDNNDSEQPTKEETRERDKVQERPTEIKAGKKNIVSASKVS